jgi:hypothetical protein
MRETLAALEQGRKVPDFELAINPEGRLLDSEVNFHNSGARMVGKVHEALEG